jgi:hypothetical protein
MCTVSVAWQKLYRTNMAAANYNELSHTANPDWNTMDPLYRWDTHFPERLSKLHMNDDYPAIGQNSSPTSSASRRTRRVRNRNCARFKTQPITFDEIKEVDEETVPTPDDTKKDLKNQFAAFSRSMDGLLPGLPGRKQPPSARRKNIDQQQMPPVPIEAAPATTNNAEPSPPETASSTTTTSTSNSASETALPANLPQLADQRRARRQKRRLRKSIEEEPELEKEANTSNIASQEAG